MWTIHTGLIKQMNDLFKRLTQKKHDLFMNRIMNSPCRVKYDLFLNITDKLEVIIHSKSTQSYRVTL